MLVTIIALIVFGFVLILVELFLVPGFIVGILGLLCAGGGINLVYQNYGTKSGHTALFITLVLLIVLIAFAMRQGFWKFIALNDELEGKASIYDAESIEVGQVGTTLSALRPAGTAMFNNKRLEVHTEGEFILGEQEVVITKVVSNKIYVSKS